MTQARNKKMAVWMTEEDYKWWTNRAWMAHTATSLFVNDQLMAMRKEIERADAMRNPNNQRKPPTLQPRSGNGGPNGGLTKK